MAKPREKVKFHGFHILYYAVLTIFAATIILPFFWLVSTSFDHFNSYSLPFPPRLLPENPSLFNYEMALKNVSIVKYLVNTCALVMLSVLLNVVVTTLSGFCLSKGRFPGRNIILLFILSNMMVPFEIKLMPIYSIIKGMGLNNNFLGVVLPGVMTNAMFIFFIKQFCDGIPTDLYEAGIIDGANKLRIYAQIFLPLMGPVIATLIVLDVVAVWNDLLWPMIVLTDLNLSTIQLGLVRYNTGSNGTVHAGIQTALSILSVLPLAIVFCFMQKYIVQSIAVSGIKQ